MEILSSTELELTWLCPWSPVPSCAALTEAFNKEPPGRLPWMFSMSGAKNKNAHWQRALRAIPSPSQASFQPHLRALGFPDIPSGTSSQQPCAVLFAWNPPLHTHSSFLLANSYPPQDPGQILPVRRLLPCPLPGLALASAVVCPMK